MEKKRFIPFDAETFLMIEDVTGKYQATNETRLKRKFPENNKQRESDVLEESKAKDFAVIKKLENGSK